MTSHGDSEHETDESQHHESNGSAVSATAAAVAAKDADSTERSTLVKRQAKNGGGFVNGAAAADDGAMEGSHGVNTLTAPPPPTTAKSSTKADGAANGADSNSATATAATDETCCQACFRIFCYPMTLPLLFIKLFHFTFIGALGCVLPFLSIYYKQQGLTPQQIGLISGLRPVIGFTSGPIWGALADRYNKRKIMLLISILSWLVVFVALSFVPSPARLDHCPEDIHPHRDVVHLRAPSDRTYTLTTRNGTENVTEEEYNILKESIDWIYVSGDVDKVFLTILLLILLGEFFQSPTTALGDAGTIQELGMENLDYYGSQRAWGPVGWALG